MNNEFEKNPEIRDTNDNTSEFENEVSKNSAVEFTPDNLQSENAENVEKSENNMTEDAVCVSDFTETTEPQQVSDTVFTEQPVYHEEKQYVDGGNAYIYSKTTPENNDIVGCVWENSQEQSKYSSSKKKKNGASGFKVFAAVMLGVFTVSSVTIAGFLAADYMNNRNSHTANTKVSDSTSYYAQSNYKPSSPSQSSQTTMISTFTEAKEGLTKSQVAEKCSPSAVGIVIEQEQTYSSYSLPSIFGDFGGFSFPSGTQIIEGSGSGFIFNSDGYIITNHHVVDGATRITVYFHDGGTAEAELVGSDALSDIAVIKIDPTDRNLIPMEIGDSSLMKVGDEVLAIGCPAGIEFMGTVTDGIISAINRDVELDNASSMSSSTKTMTLLQTNATINRGNSGGPLINTKGQVIGINTLKLSSDYEGIGFSIPMNGALPIITQLIEHGEVLERTESFVSSEGVIGISASEITKGDSEYYDIPMGVMVVQIDKDSSAAAAGLRRGDIITKFNGDEVTTVNQLNKLKSKFKAGDEVTLSVYRETKDSEGEFEIKFKLDMAD